MTKEEKISIIKKFQKDDKDVGSSEVQIALLTNRIKELTEHMKLNKKDFSSQRGLIALVNKRKKLLKYLSRKKYNSYLEICKTLKIRH